MTSAIALQQALRAHSDDLNAANLGRFFKTGPGQYGEGDQFIGVKVPVIRSLCRQYTSLPLSEIATLLESPIHEERMAGVILLTNQAQKLSGDEELKERYEFYLKYVRLGHINSWDLVDVSCPRVVGKYLLNNDRAQLYRLASSENLWERRVAIISTAYFIQAGDAGDTLTLARLLLHDTHDLIHKAVGWMLREVGKRIDESILTSFLDEHAHEMPRTMLRYAIERLPEATKRHFLQR